MSMNLVPCMTTDCPNYSREVGAPLDCPDCAKQLCESCCDARKARRKAREAEEAQANALAAGRKP